MQQFPGGFGQAPAGTQFPYGQAPGGAPPAQPPQSAQPPSAVDKSLRAFWDMQAQEIELVGTDIQEFKNHQLPLARIKKIMKSDEDVRMISAEAPVLFAKACEMFILELTLRSWAHAEDNKRRTLQRSDVAAAITQTDILDFLLDIIPKEDLPANAGGTGTQDGAAPGSAGDGSAATPGGGMPYFGGDAGGLMPSPMDAALMYQQAAQAQAAAGLLGLPPGGMMFPGGMGQPSGAGQQHEAAGAADASSEQ